MQGKTTTMRMVMGVLGRHAGEVRWQGRPITATDQRRFGYMPEERGLYPKQRVLDQLVYLGQLKGMSPPATAARRGAQSHLERFGLADRMSSRLEELSLGNQQRVQVVAALLHDPVALVLDEPFSGLDPTAVDSMADLLREHAASGCRCSSRATSSTSSSASATASSSSPEVGSSPAAAPKSCAPAGRSATG